jgi:hypothetical protein
MSEELIKRIEMLEAHSENLIQRLFDLENLISNQPLTVEDVNNSAPQSALDFAKAREAYYYNLMLNPEDRT